MRTFGSLSLKILKMLHILMIVLFLGGILSSLALIIKLDLSNFEDVYLTYKSFNIISDNVVKMGAQGTILLGAVYGFFTKWGFIKHKWLAVKWILFIAQTFIGILVVDKLMVANLSLLETEKILALSNPIFVHNHYLRLYVVVAQIGLTLVALVLSVLKPGRSRVIPEVQAIWDSEVSPSYNYGNGLIHSVGEAIVHLTLISFKASTPLSIGKNEYFDTIVNIDGRRQL